MLDDYHHLVRDGHARVVERSGEVVGLLVLIPQADHLLLSNVAVHPKAQGQGIGRLMLQEAERVARVLGYSSIRLYTNEVMTENVGLYGSIGYIEIHRAEEDGFRRIHMAKTLA
jgi:ribosomal protein S18 acetylase RimI-like enzyme